jgi:REP element-mobilizing transposase RayT
MKQLKLNLNKGRHGGRREGSGRLRIHSPGVSHRQREKVTKRTPLHLNFKYRTHVRNKETLRLLKRAILNARKQGLSVIHFSLQSNHVHIIAEAISNQNLTKGMLSLTVTMAKGLQKGKVQIERYHLHVLRTVRETKNAVEYVCFNRQKHEKGNSSVIDDYSTFPSLAWIRGYARKFRMHLKYHVKEDWPGDPAASFLLKAAIKEGVSQSSKG